MAVIETAGQLVTLDDATKGSRPSGSVSLHNFRRWSYGHIVRTQPNVRTVVSFLARNIAQLGIHLFERLDENDRQRVRAHPMVEAIRQPNPADRHLTGYRLRHRLVWDLCAFDAAFLVIVDADTVDRPALVPVSPARVEVLGNLWPIGYRYHGPRGSIDIPVENIAHFQGSADLDNPLAGVPPIEALRRVLAEEEAAGEYRAQFWRSGARLSGVITRPAEAPEWSTPARERFRSEWRALYTGAGPEAGGTPLLEDGMAYTELQGGDARSAQYVETRKLSREECAAAWHLDPTWVGVSGGSEAFASVKERRQALYQDTFGPWAVMLEEDWNAQILPAFEADPLRLERLYIKLNIAEKLRGAPADQADALVRMTGRPLLTVNEGRALLDRNPIDGGDALTVPLNVLLAGQVNPGEAAPGSTATASTGPTAKAALPAGAKAGPTAAQHRALAAEHATAHQLALSRTFERQRAEVASEAGAADTVDVDAVFDADRWDTELTADLYALAVDLAADVAGVTADALDFEDVDVEAFEAWLLENADIAARGINGTTRAQLTAALDDLTDDDEADPVEALGAVFAAAISTRAPQIAQTRYTQLAAWSSREVATQAGRSRKVWNVTSSNSRHPELDGESVPLGEAFSNGAQYPGDGVAGVDQTAGCSCLLTFE